MGKKFIRLKDGSKLKARVLSKKKSREITGRVISEMCDAVEALEAHVDRLKAANADLENEVRGNIDKIVSLASELDRVEDEKQALVKAIVRAYDV